MKLPIAEVIWKDSSTTHNWNSRADRARDADVANCRSVGYLLKSDKKAISLTESCDDDNDNVGCTTTIPKLAVVKVKILKR